MRRLARRIPSSSVTRIAEAIRAPCVLGLLAHAPPRAHVDGRQSPFAERYAAAVTESTPPAGSPPPPSDQAPPPAQSAPPPTESAPPPTDDAPPPSAEIPAPSTEIPDDAADTRGKHFRDLITSRVKVIL